MILRKYIDKRLAKYFAQPVSSVIGKLNKEDISFSHLLGSWHWKQRYKRAMKNQDGDWITPSELFRPHYSNIMANFIATDISRQSSLKSKDVHIFELGAGLGTNAMLMLSQLKQHHPDIYSRITYHLIDGSPSIHEYQKEIFQSSEHSDKVEIIQENLSDLAIGKSKFLTNSPLVTYTLAFEIFDNLPHDKIKRCPKTGLIQQAYVTKNELSNNKYIESFQPLSDELLTKIVNTFPPHYCRRNHVQWVPSISYGIILQLYRYRPNAKLIIGDFDWLPPPDLKDAPSSSLAFHAGGPLVTSVDKQDHDCYLDDSQLCDILFPTDFNKLRYFINKALPRVKNSKKIQVLKQTEFLQVYGGEEINKTKNIFGYTPLLEEFSNCSILSITERES